MKVIAVNASPHPDGNTAFALHLVLKELEAEGIKTEILQLGGKTIRDCIGCNGCSKLDGKCIFKDDIVNEWSEKMAQADGILIGTPVYYSGISGTLKCFLDRVFYSNGKAFRHKIAASVAAVRRTGGMPALDDINRFFTISEMIQPASSYWNVIHGQKPGEAEQDIEGCQIMQVLGKNMAWLLKMRQESTLEEPQRQAKKPMNFIH